MYICFLVTRGDAIGGAQIHVKDLGYQLMQLGHRVGVISGAGEPLQKLLKQHQIPHYIIPELVRPIDLIKDAQALVKLHRLLIEIRPDLISIHSSKAGILGRLVCYQQQIPFLFTVHGWSFATPGWTAPLYQILERLFATITPKIICVAETIRHQGIKLGLPPAQLVTIYNAMPDIHPELRAQPERGSPVRIMMIGRLEPQKAQADLLRAVAELNRSDVQVDLVGDGSLLASLEQLVTQLNLTAQVTFWGYRADVANLLAQAHIFVLISHWEAFPRSTLEAMRAGLPVIISDVGGAAEAVIPGVTGYVVPPGDQGQLILCLKHLIDDPEHRLLLGQAGRQHYEKLFTFERLVQQTLKVYGELLDFAPQVTSGATD
ncbi:putative glycosyl transferase [Gloeomargarita lithophora Alchichica-D10]|uniref:Putative glycosyl transferase n=1 Tax=Gloeomargarita lithophora Alchichica-D10 TaxID=1188229 RepID=A0A1J0A949_9CYAN|nr:glycosyltransferase family 4 protein [Gloeomargarita lithophora]APB32464.1 putative glycosyl transferase [Gloeomargarita lithophora Alchichica-D10]